MRTNLGIWCLLFWLGLLAAQAAPAANQGVLVFTHVTVIDGTGAPAQRDLAVVITGGRISAMGSSALLRAPTNAVTVDATGKFLIPGLWDMHVHPYEKDYLPLFIANGVVGVRVMWGMPEHHEWRKEIEAGALVGPHLFIGSAILDGPKPIWPTSIAVGNAAEGRQAVAKVRQDGAEFVKVYSVLPRDAYFAIADEAKREGIPFAGHVPLSVSVEEASEAGQKSIEHLTGILAACSSREAVLLQMARETLAKMLTATEPTNLQTYLLQERRLALQTYSRAKAEALFTELRTNHTWQCPTLVVLRNMRYIHDEAITNDPRLKYLPREIRSFWNPAGDFRFRGETPEDTAVGQQVNRKELKIVGAMQRAGVEFLAGTDTPNPYCFPGFSLHDELGLLVEAGLTPMQALQAATRNAARFMGREQELGTVETGKLADLVLLNANPLKNIANTRRIDAVVFGGRLLARPVLDEMLAKIEALADKSEMSLAAILFQTLDDKGIEAAVKQYHELKAAPAPGSDFGEQQLNNLGYRLIGLGRYKDAIKILKLNVEEFPQSSNVYDSLGEAFMDDGDTRLAIENYQKSLQLDPRNAGAIERLKQLKAR